MFRDALAKTKQGVVTSVFDTTDRVQHMFYRYLDSTHPANAGKDTEQYRDAIEQVYERMDELVGEVLEQLDEKTAFMVISDHGFTNFRRGVNLNSWLHQNGYLFLEEGCDVSGDWFEKVDWSRTKAFSLGLTGMFINRKGREASGIVEEGPEYDALKNELIAKLTELRDPETGGQAILDVFASTDFFSGPYRFDAPDLLIGYAGGYRNSWECATGSVTRDVFTDNTKSWSGDHCVDPRVVPGVFFCDRTIATETPAIVDIAPSVFELFGHAPPSYMQGRSLFPEAGDAGSVAGMFDPSVLDQSGDAPDARACDGALPPQDATGAAAGTS
jgi:predicted AlkP superfamily phosphohydrolase/phosphomutase